MTVLVGKLQDFKHSKASLCKKIQMEKPKSIMEKLVERRGMARLVDYGVKKNKNKI